MPSSALLEARSVSQDAQERFAAFCGDRNPMHMDAVAARRTQAGLLVVHGVQNLMWALETLAQHGRFQMPLVRLRARFLKWVFLDQTVSLHIATSGDNPASLEIKGDGMTVLIADMSYGKPSPAPTSAIASAPAGPLQQARVFDIASATFAEGTAFTATAEQSAEAYPALSHVIGTAAVAELAACSYVVGMEVPGLHSMFSRLDVTFFQPAACGALSFRVAQSDARFGKLRIAVQGTGLHGTLEAFLREKPAEQITSAELRGVVAPDEFVGVRALVVGGSRGLGEVAAKIIAAGGGDVTVTYAVGQQDAERVTTDIIAAGGTARSLAYDVRQAPVEQLAALAAEPTHLLYFATSTIYRPKASLSVPSLLSEFAQFYVQGFHDLCIALLQRREQANSNCTLQVLYPSTVFLEDRPAGMTEYAMMKAAGEELCKDLNQFQPGIRIVMPRLPRLPTDQTASVLQEERLIAAETFLPLLRDMMPRPEPS